MEAAQQVLEVLSRQRLNSGKWRHRRDADKIERERERLLSFILFPAYCWPDPARSQLARDPGKFLPLSWFSPSTILSRVRAESASKI